MSEQQIAETNAEHDELGEGHSPAAWTAVIVMLIGVAAGTVFFLLDQPLLVWISVAVVVVGLLLGIVLARLGYGVNGSRSASKEH